MKFFNFPERIVDAHHHLWDLSKGNYSWLQDEYDDETFILGPYKSICKNYLLDDFKSSFEGFPVVASVHVEAERKRSQCVDETLWLTTQAQRNNWNMSIVAWADLLSDDIDSVILSHKKSSLVSGIRCKPITSNVPNITINQFGSLRDDRWLNALDTLYRHDLCWDLRVPYWHLTDASALLHRAAAIPVVIEHAGLPWDRSEQGISIWLNGMKRLAKLDNVCVKLSEFGLKNQEWDEQANIRIVSDLINLFGYERCIFGSNFPVASLRATYFDILNVVSQGMKQLTPSQRDAVWFRNASKVYKFI